MPGGDGDVGDYDDDGLGGARGTRKMRGWGRRCAASRRTAPGREAFIKLALSQHRAIIAEWITSSHPGSHPAPLVSLSSSSFLRRFVFRFIFLRFFPISRTPPVCYSSPLCIPLLIFRASLPLRPFCRDPSRHVFQWLVSLPPLAQFDASPIYSVTSVAVPLVAVWY